MHQDEGNDRKRGKFGTEIKKKKRMGEIQWGDMREMVTEKTEKAY